MDIFFTLRVRPNTQLAEHVWQQEISLLAARLQELMKDTPHLIAAVESGRAHVEVEDVRQFHLKFCVPMSPVPAFLDQATHEYRQKFMQEELNEFQEGYEAGDLDKTFDSLLDLVYVAVGTALKMGLPWPAGWQRVHRANMTKRLAKPDGSDSQRNSPLDVIKPEGFVPPAHWCDLNLKPGQIASIFHANMALAHLAQARREQKPVYSLQEFVEPCNQERVDTVKRLLADANIQSTIHSDLQTELRQLEARPSESPDWVPSPADLEKFASVGRAIERDPQTWQEFATGSVVASAPLWEQSFDSGAYLATVHRQTETTGILVASSTGKGSTPVTEYLRKNVTLSYGAPFGPDVADVAEWTELTLAAIPKLPVWPAA